MKLRCLLLLPLLYLAPIEASETVEQTGQRDLPLEELQAFTEAYYQIKSSYVSEVDDTSLFRAAIRGMVASLDRHSRYLSPEEFAQFNADNEGEYAGIGLSLKAQPFGLEVLEVLKGSPAQRAKIEAGMILTHINGVNLSKVEDERAFELLEGPVGTLVTVTVASSKYPMPREFELERELILLESVRSEALPGQIGYVAISHFTLQSLNELRRAIQSLEVDSGRLKGLILDLRDNAGGVMEVAVEMSDLFVNSGKLLISSGRTDDNNHTYYATAHSPLDGVKTVVLVNGGSASASEILAAALQDHNKAIIFGEKSYGKGSIQSIIPLNSASGIKLTTAEYFSPMGHKIQDIGIQPDIAYQSKDMQNPYSVSLLDDPFLLQAYYLLPITSQR